MLVKHNLLGLERAQLNVFFDQMGEKHYRTGQLMQWLYQKNVLGFEQMSNFSQLLKTRLKALACVELPAVIQVHHAKDGCIKWLLAIDDNAIEVVYIPELKRATLCVSSQVGCALTCGFCATAQQGFNRNLTAAEIIAQVIVAQSYLTEHQAKITNVVFMGMGEPLLNEKNVLAAVDLLLDDCAFGLSRRRVTVSTAGIVPAMIRLSQSSNVSLAVSLHAADDKLRSQLMPINDKYPLSELMKACQYYLSSGEQKRHILFEYVLLKGVNDSPTDAKKLVKLLKPMHAKVNLIKFNPFDKTHYQMPAKQTIDNFQTILHNAGIRVTLRRTRGDDITAACGQLAGKVYDKSKRFIH